MSQSRHAADRAEPRRVARRLPEAGRIRPFDRRARRPRRGLRPPRPARARRPGLPPGARREDPRAMTRATVGPAHMTIPVQPLSPQSSNEAWLDALAPGGRGRDQAVEALHGLLLRA